MGLPLLNFKFVQGIIKMRYKRMDLQLPLYDLVIQKPVGVGQPETAVIERLTIDYDPEYLKIVLDEMQDAGIWNIVLDLSMFPDGAKEERISFFEKLMLKRDFDAVYAGVRADQVDDEHVPLVAESIDAAVESFHL